MPLRFPRLEHGGKQVSIPGRQRVLIRQLQPPPRRLRQPGVPAPVCRHLAFIEATDHEMLSRFVKELQPTVDIKDPALRSRYHLRTKAGEKKFQPEGMTPVDLRGEIRGLFQPIRDRCLIFRVNVGQEFRHPLVKAIPQEPLERLLKALHGLKGELHITERPGECRVHPSLFLAETLALLLDLHPSALEILLGTHQILVPQS